MTTVRHDYTAEPESVGAILARLADTEKRPAEAGREEPCARCAVDEPMGWREIARGALIVIASVGLSILYVALAQPPR